MHHEQNDATSWSPRIRRGSTWTRSTASLRIVTGRGIRARSWSVHPPLALLRRLRRRPAGGFARVISDARRSPTCATFVLTATAAGHRQADHACITVTRSYRTCASGPCSRGTPTGCTPARLRDARHPDRLMERRTERAAGHSQEERQHEHRSDGVMKVADRPPVVMVEGHGSGCRRGRQDYLDFVQAGGELPRALPVGHDRGDRLPAAADQLQPRLLQRGDGAAGAPARGPRRARAGVLLQQRRGGQRGRRSSWHGSGARATATARTRSSRWTTAFHGRTLATMRPRARLRGRPSSSPRLAASPRWRSATWTR